MQTISIAVLTLLGLAISMTCVMAAGGRIGLYAGKSVALGGCSFTRIVCKFSTTLYNNLLQLIACYSSQIYIGNGERTVLRDNKLSISSSLYHSIEHVGIGTTGT